MDKYIKAIAPSCYGSRGSAAECGGCAAVASCAAGGKPAKRTPITELQVKVGSLSLRVNDGVEADATLPKPAGYAFPTKGRSSEDIQQAILLLEAGVPSMYISGTSGIGKDAFVHMYSRLTRRPALIYEINPHTDVEAWLFSRAFSAEGTFWEEGELLRAMRDGYQRADGTRVPYLILLSDFDRANPSQAEAFRLILDSIAGRIAGPDGTIHNVLPGTQFVATANSSGGGDTTGRYITAHAIDGSLMNRFAAKLRFHGPDIGEIVQSVGARFPGFAKAIDLAKVELLAQKIRNDIESGDLHADFSYRDLSNWARATEIYAAARLDQPARRAFRVYLDGLPDPDTAGQVVRICEPIYSMSNEF